MGSAKRVALAKAALDGYDHGPEASITARDRALEEIGTARSVVLVEGVSDRIAIETSAMRLDRDLASEGLIVVPSGGAREMAKLLVMLGHEPSRHMRISGLCDAAEQPAIRHALNAAELGAPETPKEMEALGFFVCVEDLEDELIRASGVQNTLTIIDSQGDLTSFRKLQRQPDWRDRPVQQQLRRFMGSGARRKLRYARLLAGSIDVSRIPRPIAALIDHV